LVLLLQPPIETATTSPKDRPRAPKSFPSFVDMTKDPFLERERGYTALRDGVL
jgi:hypothetical protein